MLAYSMQFAHRFHLNYHQVWDLPVDVFADMCASIDRMLDDEKRG